jgi:hypothetical protein
MMCYAIDNTDDVSKRWRHGVWKEGYRRFSVNQKSVLEDSLDIMDLGKFVNGRGLRRGPGHT